MSKQNNKYLVSITDMQFLCNPMYEDMNFDEWKNCVEYSVGASDVVIENGNHLYSKDRFYNWIYTEKIVEKLNNNLFISDSGHNIIKTITDDVEHVWDVYLKASYYKHIILLTAAIFCNKCKLNSEFNETIGYQDATDCYYFYFVEFNINVHKFKPMQKFEYIENYIKKLSDNDYENIIDECKVLIYDGIPVTCDEQIIRNVIL